MKKRDFLRENTYSHVSKIARKDFWEESSLECTCLFGFRCQEAPRR